MIEQSGSERATVSAVCRAAGLGAPAFSDNFADLTDCLLATFDELSARTLARMRVAVHGQACWEDGVRAALATLLELADRHPHLAGFMLGTPPRGDLLIMMRRQRLQHRLALVLDEGCPRAAPGSPAPAFGACAVIAAAAAILHGRLAERPRPAVRELHAPLMAMIVLPYLGAEGAREQLNADRAAA